VLEITEQDGIAIVAIAHGKANALDTELCTSLCERLNQLASGPVRAAVLTGRGTIFSAGVDLLRVLAAGPDYTRQFVPALGALLSAAFLFPKPLVAAVNGHAVAGGCILACTADRRLMVRGPARIGIPELRVGVPFPGAAIEILRYWLGPAQLTEMVFDGATFEPEAAVVRGLVDEVVEPDMLIERAVACANALAATHPDVFRITKLQLRRPAIDRVASHAGSDALVTELWTSGQTIEAIRDYVDRTLRRDR
jgi:enoyl-CoA hydratase